jgi:hypothetical protein
MTRINFGVHPRELCDQHLIAEYKELPRAFSYHDRELAGPFRLNRGHVIWCSQFPGSLASRYRSLVSEMHARGFHVSYPEPRGDGIKAPSHRLANARQIVTKRICERLADMSKEPRWTRRKPPNWARDALAGRSKKELDTKSLGL